MSETNDIYSVAGVTAYIRDLFERDGPLQDIWVTGEISNLRKAASGHWYFTIKDEEAQLRCVMFRRSADKQKVSPDDGMAVNVHGRVSVYEARGEYQLYADKMQEVGKTGDLYQQFEALKQQLSDEGLFDPIFKKPLPPFPLRIGVVTSPDAAAFRDVQNVLARRFPLAEVILSPTLVQGKDAPPQIIAAIERLNQHDAADVILVCRGGGSIEDLWCFNDEGVARAIGASRLPTVSGVGHETDYTIADFVADLRAPTPSAAAEVATPDSAELRAAVLDQDAVLSRTIAEQVAGLQTDLRMAERTLQHLSPQRRIEQFQQRLDDLAERITQQNARRFALLSERLAAQNRALEAANPQALLARGYAIVRRSDDGKPIKDEDDAPPGTGLTIRLQAGEIKARVEDKDSHGRYKRTLF